MSMIAQAAVFIVAGLHIYFMILEMFFWTRPLGMKIFRLKPDFAQASKMLAMNQGLYNGFLAAGLIWGLLADNNADAILNFFLICIFLAGVMGAMTANMKILYIQALPALLALLALGFT